MKIKHIYTTIFALFSLISFGQTNLVLNGTADEYTFNTGDNADAWDMTPNSTVVDNSGTTISSPYKALWNNTILDTWLKTTYNSGNDVDEQPGSSSDGTYSDGTKTRAVKLYGDGAPAVSESTRRLYQKIVVEAGKEYTFSMDSRSEAENLPSEIFMLNEEITTEAGLENGVADPRVDHYLEITNDHNPSKGSASNNTFTTNSFTFTASTSSIVIYVRAPLANNNGTTEVFYDNISLTEVETASYDNQVKESIKIYPNPTRGAVNVSSSDQIISVGVYDLVGKQVSMSNDVSDFIDLSYLKKGVYIMKFQLQKGEVTKKIVIND